MFLIVNDRKNVIYDLICGQLMVICVPNFRAKHKIIHVL